MAATARPTLGRQLRDGYGYGYESADPSGCNRMHIYVASHILLDQIKQLL